MFSLTLVWIDGVRVRGVYIYNCVQQSPGRVWPPRTKAVRSTNAKYMIVGSYPLHSRRFTTYYQWNLQMINFAPKSNKCHSWHSRQFASFATFWALVLCEKNTPWGCSDFKSEGMGMHNTIILDDMDTETKALRPWKRGGHEITFPAWTLLHAVIYTIYPRKGVYRVLAKFRVYIGLGHRGLSFLILRSKP